MQKFLSKTGILLVIGVMLLCNQIPALAAEPEQHAWQQPITDDGNPRVLLSDFEPEEQIWTVYDQNDELKLFGDEKAPEGYFWMKEIHPSYDNVWQKPVTEGFDFMNEPVKSGTQLRLQGDCIRTSRLKLLWSMAEARMGPAG